MSDGNSLDFEKSAIASILSESSDLVRVADLPEIVQTQFTLGHLFHLESEESTCW